jgi:RES domain-containing protein
VSKIPAPVEWQDLGTEWVKSSRGVALIVPSAIIPNERNVLLNHGYPDMVRVVRQPLQSFTFDPRMRQ